jgi:hypothetical protein
MTGRGSLFVMSPAAQIAPCNHSVCHKQSEAVDSRQVKVERGNSEKPREGKDNAEAQSTLRFAEKKEISPQRTHRSQRRGE